jgi:transposase
MKKQTITLNDADKAHLKELISSGNHSARVITRARILLKAHEQLGDEVIAQALDVGIATIGRVRRNYANGGLEVALYERPRPGALKKLDPKAEALVIATACSPAPAGHSHWTLRLLADRSVELGLAEEISYETIRRTLKKTI